MSGLAIYPRSGSATIPIHEQDLDPKTPISMWAKKLEDRKGNEEILNAIKIIPPIDISAEAVYNLPPGYSLCRALKELTFRDFTELFSFITNRIKITDQMDLRSLTTERLSELRCKITAMEFLFLCLNDEINKKDFKRDFRSEVEFLTNRFESLNKDHLLH